MRAGARLLLAFLLPSNQKQRLAGLITFLCSRVQPSPVLTFPSPFLHHTLSAACVCNWLARTHLSLPLARSAPEFARSLTTSHYNITALESGCAPGVHGSVRSSQTTRYASLLVTTPVAALTLVVTLQFDFIDTRDFTDNSFGMRMK